MDPAIACVIGDLSLIRPLGRAGIPVVAVVTSKSRAHVSWSRYVRQTLEIPSVGTQPQSAVAALLDFGRSLGARPVLYFEGDDDLLLVSRNREQLWSVFQFVLPPAELIENLVDKKRFAVLAEKLGLPTPQTHVIALGTATRDERVRSWTRFPCILKPGVRSNWFGSRLHQHQIGETQKAVRIESAAELLAMLPALEAHPSDFILQALVEGGEEQIVSYHAYARAGLVIADFTGRKVRTTPRKFGFSSYVEITDDREVRRVGRGMLERLGFSGVVKLDFKEDRRDHRLYLLEANPRFNLWHEPGALAGVNLPLLVYRDLIDPGSVAADTLRARPGVRWMSAALDLRSFSEYRAAGEISALGWLRDFAAAEIVEDLCWRDPLPGLARLVGRAQGRVARARSRADAGGLA
jgi:D-aspartate ligase